MIICIAQTFYAANASGHASGGVFLRTKSLGGVPLPRLVDKFPQKCLKNSHPWPSISSWCGEKFVFRSSRNSLTTEMHNGGSRYTSRLHGGAGEYMRLVMQRTLSAPPFSNSLPCCLRPIWLPYHTDKTFCCVYFKKKNESLRQSWGSQGYS